MFPVELILRAIGVALLTLVALSVLRTRERTHRTRSVAWLAASVAAFMLTSMPGAGRIFGAFIYPLTALCSTHPVWFWICVRLLFSDRATLRSSDLVCLGAMGVVGVLYQSQVAADSDDVAVRVLGLAFAAAGLAFACLAPLTVHFGMAGDLDPRRRRLRQWFVPLFPTGTAVDVPPGVALSRLEQSVLDRLDRRFVGERLYAREGLTIVQLADLLGTQEHVLRRVINQGLGFRNFNDFLHTHRLKEAAERLGDPQLRRIPVLTIALEVGYGSVGPFNRAFKERFGVTPTEYRRQHSTPHSPFPESA